MSQYLEASSLTVKLIVSIAAIEISLPTTVPVEGMFYLLAATVSPPLHLTPINPLSKHFGCVYQFRDFIYMLGYSAIFKH